jgi:hypothetical protein
VKLDYARFVEGKLLVTPPTGIPGAECVSEHLFAHQRALVNWALRRGRAAIFAAMGLGKSRMAITWADHVSKHTGKPVIILTPLAVAPQMRDEAERIGIEARVAREAGDVGPGINICNYQRVHKLDCSVFGGVVFDESGCIKGIGSKTLQQLLDLFGSCPWRLACTATPSPNSWDELCQHVELLGVAKRSEALAEYFTRDGGSTKDWRVKGHAQKRWWTFVASFGAMVRSPADLGFDGSAYVLPPIEHHYHVIDADADAVQAAGWLFVQHAETLMERRSAKRASLGVRVERAAELVNADNESWLVWSEMNDESRALTKAIRGAVEITGSMDIDAKEEAMRKFISGEARVLVSKPSLCGHGVNLQHCANVCFAGITDSFEQQFQAIGRVHRFGQKRPVNVHYFLGEMELKVLENVKRKAQDAIAMGEALAAETREVVRAEVLGSKRMVNDYVPTTKAKMPAWLRSET